MICHNVEQGKDIRVCVYNSDALTTICGGRLWRHCLRRRSCFANLKTFFPSVLKFFVPVSSTLSSPRPSLAATGEFVFA